MANRETSDAMSSLAARVLNRNPAEEDQVYQGKYNTLLADAKKLAGSVLSQDETAGKRGLVPSGERQWPSDVMAMADPFDDETMYELIEAVVADPAGDGARDAIHNLFDPWVQSARQSAARAVSPTANSATVSTRDVLQEALYLAVCTLAFHGRDRGTGRQEKMLDDLEELSRKVDPLIRTALAQSVEPTASSTAYEMLAAAEKANVEITETLVNMVIATVLAKLIDEQGGGRANLTFSAIDMDHMLERYEMDAVRDGMEVTVKITPKPGAFAANGDELVVAEPVMLDSEDAPPADDIVPHSSHPMIQPNEDTTDAEPQSNVHNYNRPLWAARVEGKLFPTSDRRLAERVVENTQPDIVAQVENRFCYHAECPAERCNIGTSEVTSND